MSDALIILSHRGLPSGLARYTVSDGARRVVVTCPPDADLDSIRRAAAVAFHKTRPGKRIT